MKKIEENVKNAQAKTNKKQKVVQNEKYFYKFMKKIYKNRQSNENIFINLLTKIWAKGKI